MKRRTKVDRPIWINVLLIASIVLVIFSNVFSFQLEVLLHLKPNITCENSTQIHFINVGQGDAIAVKFSNGKTMLIDSGTSEYYLKLSYYLDNVILNDRKTLDYVVLTHPDIDHSGNMKSIIEKYKPKKFFRPKVYEESEYKEPSVSNSTYKEILKALKRSNIDTEFCDEFMLFEGKTKINFLSTLEYNDLETIETNDFSTTVIIEENNSRALFAGDISSKIEDQLIDKYGKIMLDVDILKLSHHGSKYSNSKEFLEITSPKYVVASCGLNTYGHPANETLQRLLDYDKEQNSNIFANFLTTKDNGNIIYTLKNKIVVQTIKNIDDYGFSDYWIYSLILVVYLCYVLTLPYYKAFKKDYRFYKQNRDYDKMKEKEKKNQQNPA